MKIKVQNAVIFFLPVVLLIFAAGLFFFRAPVLLVSDAYFNDLYGKNRTIFAGIKSSLSLFRWVKLVSVAEDIGPDGIAFAVSEVSENPYCVYFPNRYRNGAAAYQNQFPSTKIILFAEKENTSALPDDFFVVQTDTEADLYRAGRSAALISAENEGKILCYIRNSGSPEEKNAFTTGLKDGGAEKEVQFIDLSRKYTDGSPVSCIVLTGSAEDSFITEKNLPIILFSWADPSLLPPEVKVIFSDSPWEMLLPAVKMLGEEDKRFDLPSAVHMHPQSSFSSIEKRALKNVFLQKNPFIK